MTWIMMVKARSLFFIVVRCFVGYTIRLSVSMDILQIHIDIPYKKAFNLLVNK
jgi:hypothetical protein